MTASRRRRPMRSFAERNPVVIAVVGMVVLVLLATAILRSRDLPIVGDGPTYAADFSEAAGLRPGDDVDVAGVRVGSVSRVALAGGHVRVEFRVKNAWLGDNSTAAIRIKTLLGAKYLAITPVGTDRLRTSDTIALDHTSSPFDVTQAFSQLSDTVDQIDTDQLGQSFEALSSAFADTPDTVRVTLNGLTDLSRTISSRDAQLAQLLTSTQQVSATIAESDPQIQALISDGDLLVTELQSRSSAITALLQGTVSLSQQLKGLVADNDTTIGPALASLSTVTDILQANQTNLQNALKLIGPYYGLLNDALGNGRWLDTYICGLFDSQDVPVLDKDATRNCAPQSGGGS